MKTKRQKLWIPAIVALFLATLLSGCKDEKVGIVGVCPIVVSTVPTNGAVNIPTNQVVTATFNEKMKSSTITGASFTLTGSAAVAGTVTYSDLTASLTPSSALAPFSTYTGLVKTTAKDLNGNALQADYTWTFTTIPEVTLSSLPITGGTTSGAGTFNQGSLVTVTATPNTGYVFSNWTYLGVVVSTNASYQFTMAGNRALVANFTSQYTLALSSSPAAGGSTGGAGSFTAGASVIVTATPNTGYTFVNWTDNGVLASTSASYTFLINANRTLVANFLINSYTLNVTAANGAVAKVPSQATYTHGTTVALTATPNAGYVFSSWSGDVTGSTNPLTVTMDANKNITANFTLITYTLNVTSTNGTVVKNPSTATYLPAATVTLTATANTGYTFTSWSGDATGSTNPLTVTMNANKNITANYTINTYTLTVAASNGTVAKVPNQATYNYGTTATLTATPNTGYIFSSWSGDATGSTNPLTVTIDANKNITANFTQTAIVGPGVVNLGTAGNFVSLTKSGISTTGVTSITGNIGVSPAAASAITGFGLIMSSDGQSSHTPIVTGLVYASDYAAPTPINMTTAVSDMETAYTTANNLVTPAPIVDLYAGDISGRTLPQGLYKWSTGVLITNAGVTLSGGANDTWVFQIAQNLTVNNSAIITLTGGAQAKNIFWVVAGQATLGTNVDFSGIILSKTLISLNTGAKVTGRLLAQTAVTLNASTVIQP